AIGNSLSSFVSFTADVHFPIRSQSLQLHCHWRPIYSVSEISLENRHSTSPEVSSRTHEGVPDQSNMIAIDIRHLFPLGRTNGILSGCPYKKNIITLLFINFATNFDLYKLLATFSFSDTVCLA
ncbi:hypothetical protein L9F63_012303, partial [Diploptera punctata]